jgi:hypothetical protein
VLSRSIVLGLLVKVLVVAGCAPPQRNFSPATAVPPPRVERIAPATAERMPERPVTRPAPPANSAPVGNSTVAQAAAAVPRYGQTRVAGIRVDWVSFDARRHGLTVADQAGGPGSQWPDAAAAGRATGAIAAINAGFFTPEGEPLGLVISAGQRRGALNRASSLGSGMYVAGGGGRPQLLRREMLASRPNPEELLQSGPFLVEDGRAVVGLSAEPARERSFLAWDGRDQWLMGQTSACSLLELGAALAGARPADFVIRYALNLDGGRSTDLWVSAAVANGPVTVRPPWNRQVRNFLVLLPR